MFGLYIIFFTCPPPVCLLYDSMNSCPNSSVFGSFSRNILDSGLIKTLSYSIFFLITLNFPRLLSLTEPNFDTNFFGRFMGVKPAEEWVWILSAIVTSLGLDIFFKENNWLFNLLCLLVKYAGHLFIIHQIVIYSKVIWQ